LHNKLQSSFKALEGVRVLDLTRIVVGSFSAMILADLGG